MQEMRRFPGANFPEFAAIHFGIRNLRVSTADKLARLPINQRFLSNFSHVYMLQLAIRGDDDQISMMIRKFSENGKNSLRAKCAEDRDFYSLLLKRDKAGLESLIQSKHAPLNSADPIDEEFLSYLGVLEAKLCWRRGIPVEIDHPLVPMELMPVKPLDHYDDVYDFLKPGWVPPRQGLIGRVSRWFKA
ncbi:Imm49 family immunity protein [Burkholderia glumae]|uniref:Imm49 family immunity protein n=1 Tax=Burkholderia glumae TaxID=337 RepID=UPI0023DEC6E3|nr:Imm49 family immunity protein [Burkholderia glumae]